MLRKFRRFLCNASLPLVMCLLLLYSIQKIKSGNVYNLWVNTYTTRNFVSQTKQLEESTSATELTTTDNPIIKSENSAKEEPPIFSQEKYTTPGNMINDSDVTEALQHYRFHMRSTANTTLVVHQYIGGEQSYNTYLNLCGNISYNLSSLPTASVIISFHQNERVESILHTLHSIHLNSPPELLKEVILIDDNSRKISHKKPLEDYVSEHFPKNLIKIYRHYGEDQLGLIKGRLLGIKMASGEVVVCMDAHMELQPRWLEPLLQPISVQRNTMATCHLDWMKPDDFDPSRWVYTHGLNNMKTTWVWKTFNFGFRHIRSTELSQKYNIEPFNTPMSVGTLWAMDKSFFFEIGGFDDGMVLWGGENIDLPIRVHLCSGGRVLNVPCSKAAHQEIRHQRDYRMGWKKHFNVNFKRIAEVWLDGEYKETFDYYNQPLASVDPGDLSERRALRQTCPHNFSYYMQNAFPEMGVDAISFAWQGMVNLESKLCFYYSVDDVIMGMKTCQMEHSKERAVFLNLKGHLRQYLSIFNIRTYSDRSVLKRDDYFADYFNHDKHTVWMHSKDGCLYAPKKELCLGVLGRKIALVTCNGSCSHPSMQWKFRQYTHYYKDLYDGHFKKDNTGQYQNNTKYYQQYRGFLYSSGRPVEQSDIESSVTEFRNFIS